MKKINNTDLIAKPIVVLLFISVTVFAEFYILKDIIFAVEIDNCPNFIFFEMGFCLIFIAGMLFSFNKKGLRNRINSIIAGIVFAFYLMVNIIYYNDFVAVLADGFSSQGEIYGPAFQVAKLFAIFMGVVAAIPSKKQMTQEEYADQFVEMMDKQKMLWAANNAKGAKKDLEKSMMELRAQLGEEAFEKMMSDFDKKTKEQ